MRKAGSSLRAGEWHSQIPPMMLMVITKWHLPNIRVPSQGFSCTVPWTFVKGDSSHKTQLYPHMAPHLGLAPLSINRQGCAVLKLNKAPSVLISLRVCLFTQPVWLYFLVVCVLPCTSGQKSRYTY